MCYDFSNVETLLNQQKVKSALGVRDDLQYVLCSTTMHNALLQDWMTNLEVGIPALLEDGIKLLVYVGDRRRSHGIGLVSLLLDSFGDWSIIVFELKKLYSNFSVSSYKIFSEIFFKIIFLIFNYINYYFSYIFFFKYFLFKY